MAKRTRKKPDPSPTVYEPPSAEPVFETIAFPEPSAAPRKPRKTLAEMAAGDNPPGIVCRNCRQSGWIVWYTRQVIGKIMRVRKCRNCGQRTTTFEREAGAE